MSSKIIIINLILIFFLLIQPQQDTIIKLYQTKKQSIIPNHLQPQYTHSCNVYSPINRTSKIFHHKSLNKSGQEKGSIKTPLTMLVMLLMSSNYSLLQNHSTRLSQNCIARPCHLNRITDHTVKSNPYHWQPLTNKTVHTINGNRANSSKGLRLATWNPGPAHLVNKISEIESVIQTSKPHLLVISEANLKKVHDLTRVQIPGYELFTAGTLNNIDLNISRLVIYKHESVTAKLREDLMSADIDSIWMQLGFKGHKKIIVGGLYRVWQNMYQSDNSSLSIESQLQRWRNFLTQWEDAMKDGQETIVLGDFNLDWFSSMDPDPQRGAQAYRLRPLMEEFKTRIMPLGVVQCVRSSTRSWSGQTDSCLDLMFTNIPEKMSKVYTFTRGYSDHKLVMGTRFTKNIKEHMRYTTRRSYRNFDKTIFLTKIREANMLDIYLCQDPNKASELLTQKLNSILNVLAPVKKIQIRKNYAPWITEECKVNMDSRDHAQKKAIDSGATTDWSNYKRIRNDVTKQVKQAKVVWQRNKMETSEGNPSKVWSNVLSWLNWSSTNSPSNLYNGTRIENSPIKLANIMNEYYIKKISDIRTALATTNIDPLGVLKKMMNGCSTKFQLQPVHPELVDKIIRNLKNSKSCGLHHVDTSILKLAREELTPAITQIVNLSITNAVFPTPYKRSKIAPLYKSKGDKLEPSSYRPVALLPVISKILERVVYLQIVEYMDKYDYFHPNHHGFRASHSTTTALLQMYDLWMESVDRQEIAGIALVNMSAAFDCVDSDILLSKLELYGFSRHTRQWIWSYMTDRTQVVSIDGSISSALRVNTGVPQGSILGPLFYVLYTNELPEVVHGEDCQNNKLTRIECDWTPNISTNCRTCGEIVNYADDSSYTATNRDPEVLSQKLGDKYNAVSEFLTANKLKVNDTKTHTMMLTTSQLRRSRGIDVRVQVGTENQELSQVERLLGLQVNQSLKFQEHIMTNEDSVIRSLHKRVNAIKMLSKVMSFKIRLLIANGIFMSKLIYVIPV